MAYPDFTYSKFEDFQDASLTSGFTQTDTIPLITLPNNNGWSAGINDMSISYANAAVAYIERSSVSSDYYRAGMWHKTLNLANYSTGSSVLTLYNASSTFILRLRYWTNNGYPQFLVITPAGTVYGTLHASNSTHYFISVIYYRNNTGVVYIYDATNALVDTITITCPNYPVSFARIGKISTENLTGVSSGYYNFVDIIDGSHIADPILGYLTSPTITGESLSIIKDGDSVTYTGTNYKTPQGIGKCYLAANSDGSGINVEQTVTDWSDTSITVTIVKGTLGMGAVYPKVTNSNSLSGVGSAQTLTSLPSTAAKTLIVGGQGSQANASDNNGGAFGSDAAYATVQGANGGPLCSVLTSDAAYVSTTGIITKTGGFTGAIQGAYAYTYGAGWTSARYLILGTDGANNINIGVGLGNNSALNVVVGGALKTREKSDSLVSSGNGDTIRDDTNEGTYTTAEGYTATLQITALGSGGFLSSDRTKLNAIDSLVTVLNSMIVAGVFTEEAMVNVPETDQAEIVIHCIFF